MKMGNPEMVPRREPVAQGGFVYQMGCVQVRFILIRGKYNQMKIVIRKCVNIKRNLLFMLRIAPSVLECLDSSDCTSSEKNHCVNGNCMGKFYSCYTDDRRINYVK